MGEIANKGHMDALAMSLLELLLLRSQQLSSGLQQVLEAQQAHQQRIATCKDHLQDNASELLQSYRGSSAELTFCCSHHAEAVVLPRQCILLLQSGRGSSVVGLLQPDANAGAGIAMFCCT